VTFATVRKCHHFEFVTTVARPGFFKFFLENRFGHMLVTNVANGHKFKRDWYNPVLVSVSIEMVENE